MIIITIHPEVEADIFRRFCLGEVMVPEVQVEVLSVAASAVEVVDVLAVVVQDVAGKPL